METLKFVYYKEGRWWVGWLEDYPDYRTQGATLDELRENLRDICSDIEGGKVAHAQARTTATGSPRN